MSGENPNVRRAVEEMRQARVDHERKAGIKTDQRKVESWSRQLGERYDRKRGKG